MKYIRKHLNKIIPTILLVAGIVAALLLFIQDNTRRIVRQNEDYLDELTTQRAISIDSMISENVNFIHSTAHLYGKSLTSRFADVAVIRDYEENAVFEHLRFIDASGDDYTSRGVMANLSDRDYFQAGMRGESGIVYVPDSRVTSEKQIGFYSPVWFEDEIVGVMVGFYGEEYINRLLEYELFGYDGEGWLCARDGTVLGTTAGDGAENYLAALGEDGRCAPEEFRRVSSAFAAGESIAFTYREGADSVTGYAVALTNADWVLIRSFPPSASNQILENANREGMVLIGELVALFAIYIVVIAAIVLLNQRRMREINRNANDISTGVSLLLDKFIAINLEARTYNYISGEPDQPDLTPAGGYGRFVEAVLGRVADEKERREAADFLSLSNLQARLGTADRVSGRIHAPLDGVEWYTFNFMVIERADGAPRRLLLVCQDVTDLHRKEEAEQKRLQEALSAAERASRAKTEFLFNMSHDLRTPMNAIIGYTELAQREDADAGAMRGFIRKIDSSSQHLLALINDILEMSRIESGKLTLEPVPTDLVRVMEEAREMFAAQMAGKSIDFTVDASGVRDRWASCDRNRFNRILLNLISNAYKFTDRGGRIAVTFSQPDGDGGEYELRVKDDGIGMSPEFAGKLFSPFERERTSTVSGIQGTGLGLSITKSIVDLMGGSIEVFTEQGRGTEFVVRLRLPPASPEAAEPEAGDAAAPAVDFSAVRLLLAEDNAVNREIATMILSQFGFTVDTAENGRIALEMVERSKPGDYGAVLMDIQMPVMDGYSAARAIRALPDRELAGIPILAMTANAFREDVEAAREAGMNGHIAKPLDVNRMIAALTEVLAK